MVSDEEEKKQTTPAGYAGWACALAGVGVFGWQIVGHLREGKWMALSLLDALKWVSAGSAHWVASSAVLSGALSVVPVSLSLLLGGLLMAWLR